MEVDPHHILIEDPDGSCTLILDNLTGIDSGQYMCFAASAAGNASTLGKILVQGEPGRQAGCGTPGPIPPHTTPTGLQACERCWQVVWVSDPGLGTHHWAWGLAA